MPDRIKIVHLITGLNVGGAEMMLYRLLSTIDRARFENSVISLLPPGPIQARIEELGVPVQTLSMSRRQPRAQGIVPLRHLRELMQTERPDILQAWMYHANLLGLIGGRSLGISNVVWNLRCTDMRLGEFPASTLAINWVCARLSWLPAAVIVNSEAGRQLHESLGYHPRRWEQIDNGFDLERYQPRAEARSEVRAELGLPEECPLSAVVARYHPMKGHMVLLDAIQLVHVRQPDLHVLLVGRDTDEQNRELVQAIDDRGLNAVVHLLGERHDIPRIMASLDFLISSSAYNEGFPNVIGEAMACGAPCVVTDVGDSARIVGDTGIVVPPRDPTALAAAALRMLTMNPCERQDRGERARRRIGQNFSIDSVATHYESLYASLSQRRARQKGRQCSDER